MASAVVPRTSSKGLTTTEGERGHVLVLYPPGIGYYVDREFPALLPGFSSVYAVADQRIPEKFRMPPTKFVFPSFRTVVPGMPGSPLANRRVEDLDVLLEQERPSVVVTYECFSSLSAQVARSRRRPKFRHVVLCYETVPPNRSLWGWFPLTHRFAQWTCRSADLFVAHSQRAAIALAAAGAPDERIFERSPGVYPITDLESRTGPPVSPSDMRLLYVGSFSRNKGILTLTEAARQLGRSDSATPSFQYDVVGAGPLEARVKRRSVAIRSRFHLLGRVDETTKSALLRTASALVYPSEDVRFGPLTRWEEQTATAAMEAMAAGVPVIGSDSGALPEIIGDAGWTFPQGSSRALADQLRRVANAGPALQQVARRAGERARVRYNIYRCAIDVAERLSGLGS